MNRRGAAAAPAVKRAQTKLQANRKPESFEEKESIDSNRNIIDDDDDFDASAEYDSQPLEVKRIPDSQIKNLSTEQLNEVFTKLIYATDPNVNRATTRFNYQELSYKVVTTLSHTAIHFEMDGNLFHVDSDEAREQEEYLKTHKTSNVIEKRSIAVGGDGEGEGGETSAETGISTETDDLEQDLDDDHALKNQFNFSDRATQTFNNPMREREATTEPPPTAEISGSISKWEIFDAYLEDIERQMLDRAAKEKPKGKNNDDDDDELEAQPGIQSSTSSTTNNQQSLSNDDIFVSDNMKSSLKLMERIVNQNSEADIFYDYKYFDGKSDHKRSDATSSASSTSTSSATTSSSTSSASTSTAVSSSSGDKSDLFLPLWRFQYEKAKRRTVTSIVWNHTYTDLFAVGFGSYEWSTQNDGLICVYTLKNTSYPEYQFTTSSGVMCLDFHPQHPSLLVAGLYDGSICVYDVRSKDDKPIFVSNNPKQKHTDPVWQVRWAPEEPGKNINFFSISSDGRVTNWIVNKNELINEEVTELKLVNRSRDDQLVTETAFIGLAGGCCFDFNPNQEHLFVVGTEEGSVLCYSIAFNTQLVRTFEGHHMGVYAVRWNRFHPGIFLSCSADWTVKLWEVSTNKPVMTWDLNSAVADIAWAPYSSTVFAVATTDGKVRVFDLAQNKHEEIGLTRLNKKSKLTHLVFSPVEPVLCVGDDRGSISSLKLSFNLHRPTVDKDDEIERLEKILIIPDRDPAYIPQTKKKEPEAAKSAAAAKPGSRPRTAQGEAKQQKSEDAE